MNGYIIKETAQMWDDSSDYGIMLDENECKTRVDELDEPYKKECNLVEECYECVVTDREERIDVFTKKDTCDRCDIKSDRHGEYCENRKNGYYDIEAHHYYYNVVEIIG